VLDNVEHLVAAAPDIARLIESCPHLTILATSRHSLRLRAEREYPVAPLALPSLDTLAPPAELAHIPAIDLFVRRAEAAKPTFALTEGNVRSVAEIAVRLDGLPLAIELAAARIKILSPSELLVRLERRLPLLTGGAQDLPARQQTIRTTIGWSYELLDDDERRLFRLLSVFSGGFTLEAAEFVGEMTVDTASPATTATASPAGPTVTVLDALARLVDKNLLRTLDVPEDDPDASDARFGMLETIREYGLEALASAGEDAAARARHTNWYVRFAERAELELNGPDQAGWFARVNSEHDNLRSALNWAIERRDAHTALRLGSALNHFWHIRGHYAEGSRWLEQALALDEPAPPALRVKALQAAGRVAYYQGNYERSLALHEEALVLCRELGDVAGVATSQRGVGMVAMAHKHYARAAALYEDALRLYRVLGDQVGIRSMLNNLGLAAFYQGDYEPAAALLEQALAMARDSGARNSAAIALTNLSLVAQARRDYERAAARQSEALELYRMLGNRDGLAHCFENFALIAAARREHESAARLAGAAEALRALLGAPGRPNDREFNARRYAVMREQLGEVAFDAAWTHGASLSLDEAIAYALREGPLRSSRELSHDERQMPESFSDA
jgi:predicted ATPase